MPNSVATFLGLVLVAVSIAFNIWRYPIVWRTADSMGSPLARAEAPRPKPEPAQPSRPIAASDRPTPIPTIAAKSAAMPKVAAEQRPLPADRLEKPLVPIPQILTVAMPQPTAPAAEQVRRLPPVDRNMPTLLGADASASGCIPIYPSTGIH